MNNRREFFRGASLGVGSLFLGTFLRQLSAAESGASRPARILFFVQGNGMPPTEIQPEGIDLPENPSVLEDRPLTGHQFARSVAALEPFADRMSLIHGLSSRVSLALHGMGMGALGCFPGQKDAFQETVDAAAAKALPGLFRHVGLGVESSAKTSVIYNVSAWDQHIPLPTQCNPLLAHKTIFSLAGGDAVRKKFDANTQLMDFLADDVRRVQTHLNSEERVKLGHYLNAFESMSDRRAALVKLQDRITMAAPAVDERFGPGSYVFERMEAQLDLAAGAFIAGLTNVVTLSTGAGFDQTGIDCDGSEIGLNAGPIPLHEVSHNQRIQGVDPAEILIRTRARHCELLAGFVRKLESMPEGDGTMMDNTLIVYLSDAAEDHHPLAYEWPIFTIGDLGGRLKTRNRYLRFPAYGKPGHRTVGNFFAAILHAVGDRRSQFGLLDPKLKDLDPIGPLTEVLV